MGRFAKLTYATHVLNTLLSDTKTFIWYGFGI